MIFQVIYFSKKGNTKKVAEAIASELGTHAEDVKNAIINKDAFVFLGSGNYGGKPAKIMTQFIEDNQFKSDHVALFGTSGGGEGVEVKEMEEQLKKKNITIKGTFFSKGSFLLFNRGRPNNEDFDNAKKFAKRMNP